jgi:hypothetical protein
MEQDLPLFNVELNVLYGVQAMANGFARYLSSAPVLAVLTVSLAFTAFMLINWVSPDLLFLAE